MRMVFCVLAVMLGFIGRGEADTGAWHGDDFFQARLISAVKGVGTVAHLDAGLEFVLEEGWKVYWRSPGDAGLPPELNLSDSVKGHELLFPAPERFSILGLDSYGYSEGVILPLRLELARPSQGLSVAANLTGLVCSDICVPIDEVLTLSVPSGEATPSPHARNIAEAKARVPSVGTALGVGVSGVAVNGTMLEIAFERNGEPVAFQGDIFIEAGSGYGFSAPKISASTIGDGVARLEVTGREAAALNGTSITITAVAQDFLLEAGAVIGNTPLGISTVSNNTVSAFSALTVMLAVAFLGGVILNAMPCVLPVLSLKLSSVVGLGGGERGAIRRSFLATAAGVIASFLVLGVGLALARGAGVALGWGIQFQQPIFLAAMVVVISLFGLVMLDLITLPTPSFLARINHGTGLVGDFSAGALATLLATPCSAPFVGTAIAFALTAPNGAMLAIFLAMGLGLASPWLLVAACPALVAFLPKPGSWLIWLKRILALGLFATTLWLLSILLGQSIFLSRADDAWQEWQPDLAETLAANGRTVFVDVTADWCLTCQTNKALVLNTAAVRGAFAERQVVLLKADWTHPNPEISDYLARFGRYGIPFNAVYGVESPAGTPLPEILTTRAVLGALVRVQPN